ncbi:MAG: PQQ-binding-like beta-propeller repeat protein [Fuerstiella sp.]|nr:PQQ-binding-like beta-propeller repeat protein [Fuerstiella sp.]
MKTLTCVFLFAAFIAIPITPAWADPTDPASILEKTRLEGGLVVHLGCGDGSTTAEFLVGDGFRVHGLDPIAKNVAAARKSLLTGTQYGKIVIDRLEGRSLPYADNLVNLLVVEDAALTTEAEIRRVLVPDGVAWIRESDTEWKQVVKTRPGTMDHWQHFLRSPDNNPVSKDTMVGPPNRIQWMATPKFSRAHEQQASFSAAVSDGGKMFYILDDAPRVDIRLPSEWFIIARDAFNGVELWRRRMGDWVNQFRRFRSGPASLPFRLVAADGMVFVTMDFIDPVSVLDAKTGKTIRTIPGSEKTKQIIYENGVLTLLIDEEVDQHENIDAARRRGEFMPHHCKIMKALVYSGEVQWEHKVDELVFPCMALKNGRIFGQTPGRVFSIDLETGKEAWSAEFEAQLPVPAGKLKTGEMQWESPSIVVNDNVVLAADFSKVHAYNVENGVVQWKGKSKQEYNAPPDLMLVGEDLWMRGNGARVAIDPGSGEVKTEIKTAKPYMHPRCYRGKAVGDYMLFGEMGVQMVNVRSGDVSENDWIRGTCQFGVMPANGLLYVPPDSCACNMKTKLSGLYAFASSQSTKSAADPELSRLQKGPAFGKIGTSARDSAGDWPTFRASAGRTGIAATTVPTELSEKWRIEVGGPLTSPVVADGRFYVAAKDQHTIHARNVTTGEELWQFTAGGRIDSPPTVFKGGVFFGSADGKVYALRAEDGALVWRFHAAPEDRLVSIRGQLESTWPVHGAVLIQNGELIFSAGRSSYLDGGIRLFKLNPGTGEQLADSTIWSPDEATGKQDIPGKGEDRRDVHGVLSDVLVADGNDVYMRHLKLDFDTSDESGTGVHLFSPLGLLDDTWWHRAYWMVNDRFQSHWSGWWKEGNRVASGRILSYDASQIYGFGRDKYPGGNTGQWRGGEEYQLFAYDRGEEPEREVIDRRGKKQKQPPQPTVKYRWTSDVPLLATALVATSDTVFIAGPPDGFTAIGDGEAALELKDVESALASWNGESGGILYAAAAADGKEVAQIKIPAPTVFDGMAAANGRLFLSLQDGSVVCLGKSE